MRKLFSRLLQKIAEIRAAIDRSIPHVDVLRLVVRQEPPPILIERVTGMLEALCIGSVPAELLMDAYAYVQGGSVIPEEQLERAVRFKIRVKLPWYLKLIYWLMPGAHRSSFEKNRRVWKFFKLFPRESIPGSDEEQQMAATVVFIHYVVCVLRNETFALMDAIEALSDVAQLPKGLNDAEKTLFDSFPSLARVNELPEILQRQFDASGTDPEAFFLGEQLLVERSFGGYVLERRVREETLRKEKKWKPPADFRIRDLLEVEKLLLERGRIILLRMYRRIKGYRAFAVIRIRKFVPDPNGLEIRQRRMKSISEFPRLRTTEFTLLAQRPQLFWLRILGNQGIVRERGVAIQKKRIIYVLIDRSVSMLFHGSMFKAGAVIFARLLEVLQENATMFIRFFDGEVHDVVRAGSPGDAEMLMSTICRANFVGSGGTDLNKAIRTGEADIRRFMREEDLDNPQMLLVTDGRDEVSVDPSELRGIELHAFVCNGKNAQLRALVTAREGLVLEDL